MKIGVDIPEKVACNIDDVVKYVKGQNPSRDDITTESILEQICSEYLIIEYANYQRAPEDDEAVDDND
jgi:hypothetical protein